MYKVPEMLNRSKNIWQQYTNSATEYLEQHSHTTAMIDTVDSHVVVLAIAIIYSDRHIALAKTCIYRIHHLLLRNWEMKHESHLSLMHLLKLVALYCVIVLWY